MLGGALAQWALSPLPATDDVLEKDVPTEAAPAAVADKVLAVDRRAFERQLWWVLPKLDATTKSDASAQPPPALPLELDLIGVTEVGGVLIAALYDRRADRLRLVRQGERIEDADVVEVTTERVRLTRQDGELLLTRRRPGP